MLQNTSVCTYLSLTPVGWVSEQVSYGQRTKLPLSSKGLPTPDYLHDRGVAFTGISHKNQDNFFRKHIHICKALCTVENFLLHSALQKRDQFRETANSVMLLLITDLSILFWGVPNPFLKQAGALSWFWEASRKHTSSETQTGPELYIWYHITLIEMLNHYWNVKPLRASTATLFKEIIIITQLQLKIAHVILEEGRHCSEHTTAALATFSNDSAARHQRRRTLAASAILLHVVDSC